MQGYGNSGSGSNITWGAGGSGGTSNSWMDPSNMGFNAGGQHFDFMTGGITPEGFPQANPITWPGWLMDQLKKPGEMIAGGYAAGQNYLNPYLQGGMEDYMRLRGYSSGLNNNLAQYGNPMDSRWKAANMSPNDYYNRLMSGYSQSPQAKYQQDQAMRAANQGASASGMLGSGAYYKGVQQNAADIAARDQQRYFDNIMKTDTQQMSYGQNYQNEQLRNQMLMQYLAQIGVDASGTSSKNAIQEGKDLAKAQGGMFGDLAGIAGTIAALFV